MADRSSCADHHSINSVCLEPFCHFWPGHFDESRRIRDIPHEAVGWRLCLAHHALGFHVQQPVHRQDGIYVFSNAGGVVVGMGHPQLVEGSVQRNLPVAPIAVGVEGLLASVP